MKTGVSIAAAVGVLFVTLLIFVFFENTLGIEIPILLFFPIAIVVALVTASALYEFGPDKWK